MGTSVSVVVDGSDVNGVTWTALPASSTLATAARYAQVRLRATITGGTTPHVAVTAVVSH